MLRMPFFKLALTASWLTREGKLKVRSNSPMERSETQYLGDGAWLVTLVPCSTPWGPVVSCCCCSAADSRGVACAGVAEPELTPFSSSTDGFW